MITACKPARSESPGVPRGKATPAAWDAFWQHLVVTREGGEQEQRGGEERRRVKEERARERKVTRPVAESSQLGRKPYEMVGWLCSSICSADHILIPFIYLLKCTSWKNKRFVSIIYECARM